MDQPMVHSEWWSSYIITDDGFTNAVIDDLILLAQRHFMTLPTIGTYKRIPAIYYSAILAEYTRRIKEIVDTAQTRKRDAQQQYSSLTLIVYSLLLFYFLQLPLNEIRKIPVTLFRHRSNHLPEVSDRCFIWQKMRLKIKPLYLKPSSLN